MTHRLLFVRNMESSFVKNDLDLLKKHFRVVDVNVVLDRRKPLATLKSVLKIVLGTVWAEVTFSWFGGFHALMAIRLSELFARKSIVVFGGFEVAAIPEINYGAALDANAAEIMRRIVRGATRVVVVDDSLRTQAMKNLEVGDKNIATIPTGYNSRVFKPMGHKQKMVLTVGIIGATEGPERKGLDTFVKAATYLKNFIFVVVGSSYNSVASFRLKSIAPPNVKFPGHVHCAELIAYYQRAQVYCQLSMHEGLPNALCEAMLCECVPVCTRLPGIMTAMGDIGFYVPYGNPRATATAIRKAMVSRKGKSARKRIVSTLSVARREERLLALIHSILV